MLALNSDQAVSREDFARLNGRIKHCMDWADNTVQFLALREVHDLFLDFFLTTLADIKYGNTEHRTVVGLQGCWCSAAAMFIVYTVSLVQ